MHSYGESKLGIDITYINKDMEFLPPVMRGEEYDALLELLKIYNTLTGPVQSVTSHFGYRGSVPLYAGQSGLYDEDDLIRKMMGVPSLTLGTRESLFCGGKGATLSDMFAGTLGEAGERVLGSYSFFNREREFIHGTYDVLIEKGLRCIEPERLRLFHPEQYKEKNLPYKLFTGNSRLSWVKGENLLTGEEIYLPAQLIFLLYFPKRDEELIGYSTSGGLACHINRYEAIYHAVCELIERDAVHIRWFCRIPPKRIVFERNEISSPELVSLLESLEELQIEVMFYYHSLEIDEVCVVTAIAIDPSFKKFSYSAGGGASASIEEAMIQAIREFVQAEVNLKSVLLYPKRASMQWIVRTLNIGEDDPVSKINIFFKVVTFYGYSKNLKKMEEYLTSGGTISVKSIPSQELSTSVERYNFIMNVVKKHNINPIYFDLTPDIFKKAKLVKIYIPELVSAFSPSRPCFGHPRYYDYPKKMGLSNKILEYRDLLKDPLPYP